MKFCFILGFASLTILLQSCRSEKETVFCDFNSPNSSLYIKDFLNNTGYYTHLEPAIDCSNQTGKPILIVFTCWACSGNVSSHIDLLEHKTISNIIKNNYIVTTLYTDDKTSVNFLGKKDFRGKEIKTIGQQNSHFQYTFFNKLTAPFYVIVDKDINQIGEPIGYTPLKRKQDFIKFLRQGIK